VLQSLFGLQMPQTVVYIVAVIAILAFLALFAFVLRRLVSGAGGLSNLGRNRQPRLGIVDSFALDRQRQLVIIRRDAVEHLLLIGGNSDVVIESNIVRTISVTQNREAGQSVRAPAANSGPNSAALSSVRPPASDIALMDETLIEPSKPTTPPPPTAMPATVAASMPAFQPTSLATTPQLAPSPASPMLSPMTGAAVPQTHRSEPSLTGPSVTQQATDLTAIAERFQAARTTSLVASRDNDAMANDDQPSTEGSSMPDAPVPLTAQRPDTGSAASPQPSLSELQRTLSSPMRVPPVTPTFHEEPSVAGAPQTMSLDESLRKLLGRTQKN
jgi:flagellar protein FliO/FliZ